MKDRPTRMPQQTPSSLSRELRGKVSTSSNIPALDAIRGVAALMVVVAHTIGPRQLGSMGVAVFFVLSGFLITWLLVKESDKTGRISLRDFYIRRALRIFPAFYVFWVVCIAAAALRGDRIPWTETWFCFLYMGDYYSAVAHATDSIMGICWSLGVEEKFYLLWPFVFARLHLNPTKLLKVAGLFIAALWLYRVTSTLALSLPRDYLRYAFESRFDNILFGCVLALGLKLGKLDLLLKAVERIPILPICLAASLLGLTFLEERAGSKYHYILGMTLDSAIIAVMLIQFVYMASLRGWNWLNHPVLKFFGRISYSLYLYHIVVIATVFHYLPNLRLRLAYPLVLAGSVLAAYTSYQLIEKPFLKLKDRFAPNAPHSEKVVGSSTSLVATAR